MDVERELYDQAKRLGRLEGRLEDLKESLKETISLGDEHTRFGVESTRQSLVRLDEKLTDISNSILGPEGKRAIWAEIDYIKETLEKLNIEFDSFLSDFTEHRRDHASSEGERRGRAGVLEQIKYGWVQPVITATLVGFLLIIIRFVLGVGA